LVTQSVEINCLFHFDFKDTAMGVTVLLNFNIWRSYAVHCLTSPIKTGGYKGDCVYHSTLKNATAVQWLRFEEY